MVHPVTDDGIPRDLPLIHRDAVRVVVHDLDDRVLLLWTHDVAAPELGNWWELPGGGIDAGETYLEAAIRELREETGIVVTPDQVGPPLWERIGVFRHRAVRHVQREVVVEVRLGVVGGALDASQRLDYELEDYTDHRWWPVAELVRSSERFYPGRLPELLPDLLAGREIDEPVEIFS